MARAIEASLQVDDYNGLDQITEFSDTIDYSNHENIESLKQIRNDESRALVEEQDRLYEISLLKDKAKEESEKIKE